METKNKFGLPTCIAMIVGIVIGSGIFFKSDDILRATDGNILLGAFAFIIASIGIIFGSLAIAELAARSKGDGGIITYAEEAYNKKIAAGIGIFQTFLYYPTLTAIVSYVVGIYTCLLFNLDSTIETQILIGLVVIIILFTLNLFSNRLAGIFQNATTIIKLIPLFILGIVGMVFGSNTPNPSNMMVSEVQSATWLSALIPIVFAFDGWIISTSVSHEVKNARKNIPLALLLSPLFILAIYLLYFIGVSSYLGAETIIASGDAHVELMAMELFGPIGAKALLVFVIISVLGTTNGVIMGLSQLPYTLALRNMFPFSKKISQISERFHIPVYSLLVGFVLSVFWLGIHYVINKVGVNLNLAVIPDISEIAITFNYVLFILLYVQVLRLGLRGDIKGFFKGKLIPIIAIFSSIGILYVGMQNIFFSFNLLVCAGVFALGYFLTKRD